MPSNPNLPAAPDVQEPDDYQPLTCVMPECDADLYLSWKLAAGLNRGELAPDADPFQPADASTGRWRVECINGHVILVPGPAGWSGDDDTACAVGECDHDHDDELRTWRRSDVDRLAALIAKAKVTDD